MTESPQGLPEGPKPDSIPQTTIDDAIWNTVRATDTVYGSMDMLRAVYELGRLHAQIEERFGRPMLRRHLRDAKMRSYFPFDRHRPTLAESLLAADDDLRIEAQRAARLDAALAEVRRNLPASELLAHLLDYGQAPEATITGPGIPIHPADPGPYFGGAGDRPGPIPDPPEAIADILREANGEDPRAAAQSIADDLA